MKQELLVYIYIFLIFPMIDDSLFLCFYQLNWSFELLCEILRLFGRSDHIYVLCCSVFDKRN